MGFWRGAAARIIKAVDDPRLRRIGRRRHGEVGEAAGLLEHAQFIGDAAMAPLRMRIVQRPVAVDESVAHPASRVTRQQAVTITKGSRVSMIILWFQIITRLDMLPPNC